MSCVRIPLSFLVVSLLSLTATAQNGPGKAEPAPRAEAERKQPAAPSQELAPEARALRDAMRRCLAYYFFRPEPAAQRSPWSIMHTVVSFGVDSRLDASGEDVSAIGWLCWNQPCQGLRLFRMNGDRIVSPIAAGYQGHEGQFLHIMALSRVPKDYAMQIDERRFTIEDLVKHEQLTCQARTELSFKLLAMAHYLDSDATWRNQKGEAWSIERVIQEELAQPVNGVACGGTHRLMGLGYAVRKRQERQEPLTGQWARAQQTVANHVAYAFQAQNADGTFSTNWFEGPGNWGDMTRKLNTTGHTLEWLLVSLPDEQLNDSRLAKAAQCLTALLWNHRDQTWEIGPRGHALHALAIYDERVFGGKPGERATELAQVRDDTAGPLAGEPETGAGPAHNPSPASRRPGLFSRGRR